MVVFAIWSIKFSRQQFKNPEISKVVSFHPRQCVAITLGMHHSQVGAAGALIPVPHGIFHWFSQPPVWIGKPADRMTKLFCDERLRPGNLPVELIR